MLLTGNLRTECREFSLGDLMVSDRNILGFVASTSSLYFPNYLLEYDNDNNFITNFITVVAGLLLLLQVLLRYL